MVSVVGTALGHLDVRVLWKSGVYKLGDACIVFIYLIV